MNRLLNGSINKGLLFSNILIASISLFYFGLLEENYCLSADDFSGIDYSSKGIPGLSYAWHFYFNWEGPFLSHFVHGILMWLISIGVKPVYILVGVKLAMVIATSNVLTALSERFALRWGWNQIVFASMVFVLTLYLISSEQTQIWHWLTGMVYLYPLIFLLLGLAAILRKRYFLAVIPLAVVMQSRATYSVLIFGGIMLLFLAGFIYKWDDRKRVLIMTTILLLFLLIYLVAPGNYVRMTDHGNSFSFLVSQFRSGLTNLFLSYNLAKMDRVALGLLAVIPILGTGVEPPRPKQLWIWLVPCFMYVAFTIAHETLFVYVTGYHEWPRVLSLHSFLFLIMVSTYAFWLFGELPPKVKEGFWPISLVALIGLVVRLFIGFGGELDTAKALKENYRERMAVITGHASSGDTLYVDPINYRGVLYFEDFSKDPDNWINKDFTKAYDLQLKIALEDNADEE